MAACCRAGMGSPEQAWAGWPSLGAHISVLLPVGVKVEGGVSSVPTSGVLGGTSAVAATDMRLWKGLPCPVLHSSWVLVGLVFFGCGELVCFFFFLLLRSIQESNFYSIWTDGPALSFCSSVHGHKGVRGPRPHSINTCSFPGGDVRPRSTK